MPHYHELSTETYWTQSVEKEIKELTRQRNRNAIRAFTQFVFAVAVFSITVLAVQEMPNWWPVMTSFMEQNGITETLKSWSS